MIVYTRTSAGQDFMYPCTCNHNWRLLLSFLFYFFFNYLSVECSIYPGSVYFPKPSPCQLAQEWPALPGGSGGGVCYGE